MAKSRMEICIIDDEVVVCKRLQQYLAKAGYAVETFVDSRSALARIDEKQFDVIVTDIRMDNIDGLEVLEHVVAKGQDTKVIMITGYATIEIAREAEAKGAFDFISQAVPPAGSSGGHRAGVARDALRWPMDSTRSRRCPRFLQDGLSPVGGSRSGLDEGAVKQSLLERPRFSIKARLTLILLVFFLISAAISAGAMFMLSMINDRVQIVALADRFANEIQSARRSEKNYFLYGSDLAEVQEHVDSASQILEQAALELGHVAGGAEMKSIRDNLTKYRATVAPLSERGSDSAFLESEEGRETARLVRTYGSNVMGLSLDISRKERLVIAAQRPGEAGSVGAAGGVAGFLGVYRGLHLPPHHFPAQPPYDGHPAVCGRRFSSDHTSAKIQGRILASGDRAQPHDVRAGAAPGNSRGIAQAAGDRKSHRRSRPRTQQPAQQHHYYS